MISSTDIHAVSPFIIVAVAAVLVLLVISFYRRHIPALLLTLVGIVLAFLDLFLVRSSLPGRGGILLIVDHYALYFIGLILALSAVISLFIYFYFRSLDDHKEELYVLILIAALGGMVLAAADNFISFFLGLEMLTVSLYIMISILRTSKPGLEAGLKYLILAAAASAFLVLGMAFIYAETGTLRFSELASVIGGERLYDSLYILIGIGLIIVGVGFKLGVVPFHMWTPDVYQGAPAPITAFIASVSKTAMIALVVRYFAYINIHEHPMIFYVLGGIAILSMLLGNILAVIQRNLKRLLAYSSIAHLGYILVGLVALGSRASVAVLYYMSVYALTIVGAFGIIALESRIDDDTTDIEAYRGLFWRRPWAAGLLSVFLFSLAGIPLTAGFIGKYLIILSGAGSSLWALIVILIISSVIGLYYYLRVIAAMISDHEPATATDALPTPSAGNSLVLSIVAAAVVYLGVYPGPLIGLIQNAILKSFGSG